MHDMQHHHGEPESETAVAVHETTTRSHDKHAGHTPEMFRDRLWISLLLTIPIAAIVGDQLGFLIGRKAGAAVFHRPSARRIGPKQLEQSRRFFDRYGPRTILLARFVPVARTIAPVMAGASGMKYRTFAVYNVIGGTVWGIGVPTLGYLLGGIGFVRSHIEVILILIVFLSVAPLLINALRSRQQRTTPPARRPDNASTADRDL